MKRFWMTIFLTVGSMLMLASCAKPDLPRYSATRTNKAFQGQSQTTAQLYGYYNDWRHVRYRLGGLSKKGIDCSGLVYHAYRTLFDVELPRNVASQVRSGRRVSRNRLEAGDLVFFKTGFRQRHVGIYIENNRFMHVSEKKGVSLSDLNDAYWGKHYWMAVRVQS